ncbi:MAG: secondary thiamine-phosphate synthase enzyme YjbQ [Methanomicrobia archaeon]|nr:secondary thiamine-phosphate synthase enzyme YjbQ [Methanomicrobia archaeon]MCK4432951.1 secondary thiamine-phosphate synthase enzyme YjbQ [Methanomicrobia archaeon]
MEQITVNTRKEFDLIDITREVEEIVKGNGAVVIFTPHTTCSLLINENERGLREDILNFYSRLAPKGSYEHNRVDNNAHSHLRSLFNTSVTIPVANGRLALGTWQSVFLMESDGPRVRKVYIVIMNIE